MNAWRRRTRCLVGLAHPLLPRPVVFVRAVTASASRRPVLGGAIGLDQHISGDPQAGGETANHAQGGRPAVPRYCEITFNFLSFGCRQAQGSVVSARRSLAGLLRIYGRVGEDPVTPSPLPL